MKHIFTAVALAASVSSIPAHARDDLPSQPALIDDDTGELASFDIAGDMTPEEVTAQLNRQSHARVMAFNRDAQNAAYGPLIKEPRAEAVDVTYDGKSHLTGDALTQYQKDMKTINTLQKTIVGLHVADVALTYRCLQRDECTEGNPIYGKNPDLLRLVMTKAFFSAAQWALIDVLAEQNMNKALFGAYASVAIGGAVVGWNLVASF